VNAIITLLTDFGFRDGYVGAMKGVILAINPRALPVDITHDIEAHDVMTGALALASAYSHFPAGTIHVAVVDPGVGSPRRGIIVETSRAYFVGPDNGIFTLVYEREALVRIVAIENPKFLASSVSRTFHGRDVFAPAAAHLSLGVPAAVFGPPVDEGVRIPFPRPRIGADAVEGEVIHVDRFGNLITNISEEILKGFVGQGTPEIWVAHHRTSGPYDSYEEGQGGEIFGIFGSSGLLEISMNRANTCEALGLSKGAHVRVSKSLGGRIQA
jgi:S-adenosylmethionine hydrolase